VTFGFGAIGGYPCCSPFPSSSASRAMLMAIRRASSCRELLDGLKGQGISLHMRQQGAKKKG
jgi:hypothetical protein